MKHDAIKAESSFLNLLDVFFIAPLALLLLTSSCQAPPRQDVQQFNDKAYEAHYRSLDSVEHYAHQPAQYDDDGKAEALNNLAFANIVRMDYAKAEQQLTEAATLTDNQIEQLVSQVQLMRLCQRRSRNRDFYEIGRASCRERV